MIARAAWLSLLCGWPAVAMAGTLDVLATTPEGNPVEDFAVVLETPNAQPLQKSKAIILQRDREFNPYLTIIQTGTAVDFPNLDPFKHHVYSFSQPKIFEIKLYAGKPAKPVVFDKPGVVALGCNIHDWMEAYILARPARMGEPTSLTSRKEATG
jgi:plastocyanin